jgi:hypothetical protein
MPYHELLQMYSSYSYAQLNDELQGAMDALNEAMTFLSKLTLDKSATDTGLSLAKECFEHTLYRYETILDAFNAKF